MLASLNWSVIKMPQSLIMWETNHLGIVTAVYWLIQAFVDKDMSYDLSVEHRASQ